MCSPATTYSAFGSQAVNGQFVETVSGGHLQVVPGLSISTGSGINHSGGPASISSIDAHLSTQSGSDVLGFGQITRLVQVGWSDRSYQLVFGAFPDNGIFNGVAEAAGSSGHIYEGSPVNGWTDYGTYSFSGQDLQINFTSPISDTELVGSILESVYFQNTATFRLGYSQTVSWSFGTTSGSASAPNTQITVSQQIPPPPSLGIGAIAGDNTINKAEANAAGGVAIGGFASDDASTFITLDILDSHNSIVVEAFPASSSTWSFRINALSLADGAYTAQATVQSAFGFGLSTTATRTFTVDETPPSITIGTIAGDYVVSADEVAAPVAIGGTTTGAEDGRTVTVKVLDGSNHVQDTLTTTVSGGSWGVSLSSAQMHALTSGSYTVTADVSDAAGNPATTATHLVSFEPLPAVVTETATLTSGGSVSGTAGTALAGDSDASGYGLVVSAVTGGALDLPVHGTYGDLTLHADGSFTYTADATATEIANVAAVTGPITDSFTFAVSNGHGGVSPSTLNVNLDATKPTISAVEFSPASGTLTAMAHLAITLTMSEAVVLDTSAGAPTLKLNDGAVATYDAAHSTATSLVFDYTVAGSDSTVASLTATDLLLNGALIRNASGVADASLSFSGLTQAGPAIDHAPVAQDNSASGSEDAIIFAALGATDNDGDALTYTRVGQAAHGSVTVLANGAFVYTPDANYSGSDSFTFKANDGTADSNVATETLTIAAVDDPPVAQNGSASGNENAVITGTVTATDIDSATLSYGLVAQAAHGAVTVHTDGTFAYTPDADYVGTDSFTFKANDGTSDSNVATESLTVNAVIALPLNVAPVAQGGSASGSEDGIIFAALGATDSDGDALTYTRVGQPAHGNVTMLANGAFVYTPDANYFGTDSFTFKVNDGSVDSNVATETLTIAAVNDAPVAQNGAANGTEDTVITGGLSVSDVDNTAAQLTYGLNGTNGGAQHGTVSLHTDGTFSYTPAAHFSGTDSFSFKANDGSADSNPATVAITVDPVNHAPVAQAGSASGSEDTIIIGTMGATDADGDTLTYTRVGQPAHGSVTVLANGAFVYTPDANYFGADSFSFKVNDGNVDSSLATISLTINAVDDAPIAQNGSANGNEDSVITGTVAASDPDSASLIYGLVAQAAHGTVALHTDGSFSYTPNANYAGPDSFTFKANDGSLDSNIGMQTLTVAPVNDAPVNTVPLAQSVAEDASLAIAGLSVSDIDAGSGAMTATLSVAHGTLSLAALGGATVAGSGTDSVVILGTLAQIDATLAANIVYQPALHYSGADTLTMVSSDFGNTGGGALTDTDTVAIKVTATPGHPADAPQTPPSGSDGAIHFDFKLTDATFTWAGNEVIVDTATSHAVLSGYQTYVFTDGTVNENDGAPLVDDLYYYAQNHDVWNAHIDADAHYHATGWKEGRNPDAFFDTRFYLETNSDVKAAGVDPLVQYDTAGWKAGRDPSMAFDTNAYLAANPDVKAAGIDPLAHFLASGQQEGRQATPATSLIAPNGFDYVYYLQHNPDVAAAGVDPFVHYETIGWKEGRNPNALFDDSGYLAAYADVKAAGINPLDHYHQSGWMEGRDPSANFDTKQYLAAYPDIAAAHTDPLIHFLQHGQFEGRSSFADGHFG